MKAALTVVLVGILLTSSFISQITPVFGEFKEKNDKSNKKLNQNILEFSNSVVVFSSSTTTICHIPPGNSNNQHTIIVGTSSLTAHLNHGDQKGNCQSEQIEIQEFQSNNLETTSNTLTKAIDFMNDIVINTTSDSKIGPAVSQAAELHKLFAHEDKETKKEFQKEFLKFIKNVKEKIGKGQSVVDKKILNNLGKVAIKINSQIEKDQKEEDVKNKMKTAQNLRIEKENLQKIRNQISMAKINYKTDNDQFEELLVNEQQSLTKVLISEAKSNGEKITIEKIKEINKKSADRVDNSHKTNSDKKNSETSKEKGSESKSQKGGNDKNSKKSNNKGNGKNK